MNNVGKEYTAGFSNVGSYQVSGFPYLRAVRGVAATITHEVMLNNRISREIKVTNLSTSTENIIIYFEENGYANNCYIEIEPGTSFQMMYRVNKLFVRRVIGSTCNYDISCSTTGILNDESIQYDLTKGVGSPIGEIFS